MNKLIDYQKDLPKNWTPQSGLDYPLTLKLKNGDSISILNYEEHHRFIKRLFKS